MEDLFINDDLVSHIVGDCWTPQEGRLVAEVGREGKKLVMG
jgi:hypothetical protein